MKNVEEMFVGKGYLVINGSISWGVFGGSYLFKHPNKELYVFATYDDKEIRFYLKVGSSKFEFYFDYPFDCFDESIFEKNFEGDLFDRIVYNRFGA